jgi:hypothetical protein
MENIRRVKAKIEAIKRHRTDTQILTKILSTSGIEKKRDQKIAELFDISQSITKVSRQKADSNKLNPDQLFIISEKTHLKRFGGYIEVPAPVVEDLSQYYKEGAKHWALTKTPIRATYNIELQGRLSVCVSKIRQGIIDEFLSLNVYQIAYQLMGLDGELLSKLSIDPTKGITYKRFSEVEQNEKAIKRTSANEALGSTQGLDLNEASQIDQTGLTYPLKKARPLRKS